MKKRTVCIAISFGLIAMLAALYAGFRAYREKQLAEALSSTFYRTLKIVWVDKTGGSEGKMIEIPFTIVANSMGEEEYYTRRLRIGRTKSVKLKMGHYKLVPTFFYDSPPDYNITIEPQAGFNWFRSTEDTIRITVYGKNASPPEYIPRMPNARNML